MAGLKQDPLFRVSNMVVNFANRFKTDYEALTNVELILQLGLKIKNKTIGFQHREHEIDMINRFDSDMRQAWVKSAQKGFTEAWILGSFCTMIKYPGVKILATLPFANDNQTFVPARIDNHILENAYLRESIAAGGTNSKQQKIMANNSVIYFGGRSTETDVRMIDADIVIWDEYDVVNPTMLQDKDLRVDLWSRLEGSTMFIGGDKRGIGILNSTPIYEKGGLWEMYENSQQNKWLIKCTRCNFWQELKYPDSIAHFFELEDVKTSARSIMQSKEYITKLKKVYYFCLSCKRPFDKAEIGKWNKSTPNKTYNCEWIPTYPDREAVGRHLTLDLNKSPQEILKKRDDPKEYGRAKQKFMNLVLGIPWIDPDKKIDRKLLFRCTDTNVDISTNYDETKKYYLGIDQGVYYVLGRKIEGTENIKYPEGKAEIIKVGYISPQTAFDYPLEKDGALQYNSEGDLKYQEGELDELLDIYKNAMCCIDNQPSRDSAFKFAKKYSGRIWRLTSGKQETRLKPIFNKTEEQSSNEENWYKRDLFSLNELGLVMLVSESFYDSIDLMVKKIRDKQIIYNPNLSGLDELFNHIENLILDHAQRKVLKQGSDHYAQAVKMMLIAMELDYLFNAMDIIPIDGIVDMVQSFKMEG